MRILTIEELLQVTGGGLTADQKTEVKALKALGDKAGAKALYKSYKAANASSKATKSGKGTGGPV